MIRKVSYVTILVKDQEEALDFYAEKLGFETQHDETSKNGTRWLVVGPKAQKDVGLTLLRADKSSTEAVGRQGGDDPLLVFQTNNCLETYKALKGKGVEFIGSPQERPWGVEVVFKDLYGNKFNLVQPKGWGE